MSCNVSNAPAFVRVGTPADKTTEYVRAQDVIGVRKNDNNEWHATVREEILDKDGKSSGEHFITVPLSEDTAKKLNLIG